MSELKLHMHSFGMEEREGVGRELKRTNRLGNGKGFLFETSGAGKRRAVRTGDHCSFVRLLQREPSAESRRQRKPIHCGLDRGGMRLDSAGRS